MMRTGYMRASPFYALICMVREGFPARVVSGYRITIPSVIRKRMSISVGDDVDITIEKRHLGSERP